MGWAPVWGCGFLLLRNDQAKAVDNLLGMPRKESLLFMEGCWQMPSNDFFNSGFTVGSEMNIFVLQFRQEKTHYELHWPVDGFTEEARSALGLGERAGLREDGYVWVSGVIVGYVFSPRLLLQVFWWNLLAGTGSNLKWVYPRPLACSPHPTSKSIMVAEITTCSWLLLQPKEEWWESKKGKGNRGWELPAWPHFLWLLC